MKRIVNILALFLVILSVLTGMVACNNDDKDNGKDDEDNTHETDDKDKENENKDPVYLDYTVTVVNGIGSPISDVIVKFTGEDGVTKTRATDSNGMAVLKNALAGDYDVVVEKGFSEVTIIESEFTLTSEKSSYTTVVEEEGKAMEISFAYDKEPSMAYLVGIGEYNIPCMAEDSRFLVMTVLKSGVYTITLSSDDENMTVGYYGIPMFVQKSHCGEGEYDGRSFELVIQDPNTPYVLGIYSSAEANANLKIERIADAPFDPQYAPWQEIYAKGNPEKITLPENATLTDVDICDKNLTVTRGEDGYYYTSDGKLVYLRINSVSTNEVGEAKYLDASIAYIAGLVDPNHGQNFGGYVYDDEGNFVGKYSYNNLLAVYYECCDRGVYPLTDDLVEAIKCHGKNAGWWTPGTVNFLLEGVDYVEDNAWLLLCCTVD